LLEKRRVAKEQQPIISQRFSASVYERLFDKSFASDGVLFSSRLV
jgi:hypothetical protein